MKKLGTLLMIGMLAAPLTIAGFAATQASGSTKPTTASDTATKTTKKHKKSGKKSAKTAKAPDANATSGGK
jgi:hypothetical protein